MRTILYPTLAIGLSSAACALMPAWADHDDADDKAPIYIDQIQDGDLWSQMIVVLQADTESAAAIATTTGNTGAALIDAGDAYVDVYQTMTGDASSASVLRGQSVNDGAHAASTSYGNAATSGSWDGDSYLYADQIMTGRTEAVSDIELDQAGTASGTSTAIANIAATSGEWGENRAYQRQRAYGDVDAQATMTLRGTLGTASLSSVAGGNAVSSSGETTTAIQGATQTVTAETISASSDATIGTAEDAIVASAASANSYTLDNTFGYTSLGRDGSELYQVNYAEVDASSSVALTDWTGHAAVSAYGVGNSAVVSNTGSDTALHALQNNWDDVSSSVDFTGGSMNGGVATISSVAIGNTASATLCNVCGDAVLSGATEQYNYGNTTATGTITSTGGAHILGSAAAIGNAATYQSGGQ